MESGDTVELNNQVNWKPFLRQFYAGSITWMNYFMFGLCLGSPTILIAQIRKEENSVEAISEDMASWISSAASYMGVPWGFFLVIVSHHYGRKKTCFILMLNTLIGFILFYCSVSVTHILISQIIQGMMAAAQTTITVMVATEYTSAKYRGIVCTTKTMMMYLGIWAANAVGTFYHWRNIGIIGIAATIYNFIAIFAMPESPYWLASKKQFEACSIAHYTLKGSSEDSVKELQDLINSQRIGEFTKKPKKRFVDRCKIILYQLKQKEIYKPAAISGLVLGSYYFSGKLVCTVYAIQIIKKITENESTAYIGMLTLDGITILGMIVGCVLSKFVKRRTLLLGSFASGTVALYIIVLYLFLIKFNVVIENKFLTMALLTLFSLAISFGIVMSFSIYAELIPLKCRGPCTSILSVFSKLTLGTSLKVSPYLFSNYGSHGGFLFFAVVCTVIVILMFVYLPETKDKTLFQIAELFKDKKPKADEEVKELMPLNK